MTYKSTKKLLTIAFFRGMGGMNVIPKILTIYFSGTGNTRFVARAFSKAIGARCLSIEANADFATELEVADIVAFFYPVYYSRPPRNMRDFVKQYEQHIKNKKLVISVADLLPLRPTVGEPTLGRIPSRGVTPARSDDRLLSAGVIYHQRNQFR